MLTLGKVLDPTVGSKRDKIIYPKWNISVKFELCTYPIV